MPRDNLGNRVPIPDCTKLHLQQFIPLNQDVRIINDNDVNCNSAIYSRSKKKRDLQEKEERRQQRLRFRRQRRRRRQQRQREEEEEVEEVRINTKVLCAFLEELLQKLASIQKKIRSLEN